MTKIIHIIKDEKFVDGVVHNYETILPNGNVYLVVVDGIENGLKYTNPHPAMEVVSYKELHKFIRKFFSSDVFIFHGLDRARLNTIKRIPAHKTIVVHFWGSDIYLLPRFNGKLLKENTLKVYKKTTPFSRRIKDYLRGYFFELLYKKYLGKVSFYSTVVPTESTYISRYLPNAQQVYFNYVDIEGLNLEGKSIHSHAQGILIGNSSSFTGNHVDVIKRLAHNPNLGTAKKVLPLNYGDEKYAGEIANIIRKNDLTGFEVIKDFLPIATYLEILMGCSVAIMHHQRQQAVGNILMCIWLGMKVFLSEKNPIYPYFEELGIVVLSYEKEIDRLEHHIREVLSEEKVIKNRQALRMIYSKENTLKQTRELIEMVHAGY